MESKTVFVIFIVVLLIASISGFIFWLVKFNKNVEENKDYNNVNILVKAVDYNIEEMLRTNFLIVQEYFEGVNVSNKTQQVKKREVVYNGITNNKTYEEVNFNLKKNITNFYFLNYGSGYYADKKNVAFIGDINNNDFEMSLHKIGVLNITLLNKNENNYILNLSVEKGQWRQLGFCVSYTINYLKVLNEDYIKISTLKRFERVRPDNCYYTYETLKENESLLINLKYEELFDLVESDKIDLVFFDSDKNIDGEYAYEDVNRLDIGGEDYYFTINN